MRSTLDLSKDASFARSCLFIYSPVSLLAASSCVPLHPLFRRCGEKAGPLFVRHKAPSQKHGSQTGESPMDRGTPAACELPPSQADSSTAGLVQSYGDTPGSTPVRTPRRAG